MKDKRLIVLISAITLMVVGVGLMLWATHIINNFELVNQYETLKEAMQDGRHAARPQLIGGIGLLAIVYVMTYIKPNNKKNE